MSDLLQQINNSGDLKRLRIEQLSDLADEIRQFMLNSISKTGGHLASNLGVIELTVALHYVFDFKTDRILWDVGHQCYAHKIITGRRSEFERLRQADGISGFPNPQESIYDPFAVGHAGTSIATAAGMAIGQERQGKDDKIVAVVGDASIVNGVSFEALNNLGLVKRQMLIVLNDNSMAIDPTQGALAKYFSKVRLSQTYEELRRTTTNILEHMPVIGKGVEDAIERIKKSIRMALAPSQMFESLNIPYFGPVDGHDIGSLVSLFRGLAQLNRPAILHVYTKKGNGFNPAEGDLPKFHSTGPFRIVGDQVKPPDDFEGDTMSFTSVFGRCLVELAEKDERIVAITSAMCEGTGLGEFRTKFPKRFFDVGIAESAAVDIAAGMAKTGLKPVVCIYSTFLQRSFDQIFQEVSLQNLPVVFCIDRAGVVGADGPTHHGMMDIGFLRMMPNMILVGPANDVEMKLALEFAVSQDRPVAIRYPKDTAIFDDDTDYPVLQQPFVLGRAVFIRENPGSAAAIVSYGGVLGEALKAVRMLEEKGMDVELVNARFAAPVDGKIIDLIKGGKAIITVEDHQADCGFGSALLEGAINAIDGKIAGPIKIIGAQKTFLMHNSRKEQLMQFGVNAEKIARTVMDVLSHRKARRIRTLT